MNQELYTEYLKTDFKVFNPDITIKIGADNKTLNEFLMAQKQKQWAYITPCNPFSKVLTVKENKKRLDEFKKKISHYTFYSGEGVGSDPAWKPEASFLILGISRDKAISLGNEYGQNAIVYGSLTQSPELILLQKIQ